MLPKKYLRMVRRRLCLPSDLRRQALSQLPGEIHEKINQGQSWEDLSRELGSPSEAAARIQAGYPGFPKSPWRFAGLALLILGLAMSLLTEAAPLLAGFLLTQGWLFPREAESVGIIGGADGPTAVFISSAP